MHTAHKVSYDVNARHTTRVDQALLENFISQVSPRLNAFITRRTCGVVAGVFVVMSVVLLSDSRAGPHERDREMFQLL